jgi:hypothetical protein
MYEVLHAQAAPFPSPFAEGGLLPAGLGCIFNLRSSSSAFASNSSIFFSKESRWFSSAAAARSPRARSLKACIDMSRDLDVEHSNAYLGEVGVRVSVLTISVLLVRHGACGVKWYVTEGKVDADDETL